MSLKQRLTIILLSSLSGLWLIAATANYLNSGKKIADLFDEELMQSAEALLAVGESYLAEIDLPRDSTPKIIDTNVFIKNAGPTHEYNEELAFQVWAGNSTLVIRSSNAPNTPLSATVQGFSDKIIANNKWRIFSFRHPSSPLMIQVGEKNESRQSLQSALVFRVLLPLLMTLPFLALLVWYGVKIAMRPLDRLTSEVAAREVNKLDLIDTNLIPGEVLPLVESLNSLLIRMQGAYYNERHFTADAAHELRTPLAAMKAQAQVAQLTTDPQVQQGAIQKIVSAVDIASRLVQQMLVLARVDQVTADKNSKMVDMRSCALAVMAELAALAAKKNIDIRLAKTSAGTISGNSDTLAILITNLIHNAIHYTPENGVIVVDIVTQRGQVTLSVSDSGPGIPPAEREKVLRRFYRGPNVAQTGSGLGLSIVARIAELHHARIALSESVLGGLRIDAVFPAKP